MNVSHLGHCASVIREWEYGVRGRSDGWFVRRGFVGVMPVRIGQQESRYCTSLDKSGTTAQAAGFETMTWEAMVCMSFTEYVSLGLGLI